MQAIEKIVYSNNWITIVLLFLFIAIVLLKLIDAKKLKESFFAFFNFGFLEDDDVDSVRFFDAFQIVIFFFTITVLSLVVFKFKIYLLPESTDNFVTYLTVYVGLLFYFLIKKILEYALSLLFFIKNKVQFYFKSKNNYLFNISFLVYIALILCEYANVNQLYLFYFAAFLFGVRFIFSLVINKKLIFNQLFYFILYICAFEIAPLFVLFKLMF